MALAGCVRGVSDAAGRPAAAGRFTLRGVRPREAFAAHAERLGPPRRTVVSGRITLHEWDRLTVTVDASGAVVEASGDSIDAGGRPLVRAGASEAELTRLLGPNRSETLAQPQGVTRAAAGRVLLYDDDGVRFELELAGDALARVRAFVPRPGAPGSGR